MTMIKRATTPNSKISLAVKKVNCPYCGTRKVAVLLSDKKCPKCGNVLKLSVLSESK